MLLVLLRVLVLRLRLLLLRLLRILCARLWCDESDDIRTQRREATHDLAPIQAKNRR